MSEAKETRYDAIIIGGGHNGLICASFLAKKKKKVLLVEKESALGGTARSEEFHSGYFTPGLLHETESLSERVVRELKLKKQGLRFHEKLPPVFLPEKRGRGLSLCRDLKTMKEEVSQKDLFALEEYYKFFKRLSKVVHRLVETTPPHLFRYDFANLNSLLRTGLSVRLMGKTDLTELIRMAPMSVGDWLNERFESKLLKAGLAGPAVYGQFAGPWSPGTTTNLLFHEATVRRPVMGGPQALISCLQKTAKALGVQIKTNTEVKEINLVGAKTTGITTTTGKVYEAPIVSASCDPKSTFLKLIEPKNLTHQLAYRITNYRTRGTTAKVNLALEGNLEWQCRSGHRYEFTRTGEELDDLEKAFDAIKYGQMSKLPCLEVFVPSVSQPNLAPAGHSSVSILVHFAPYHLQKAWDDKQKESLFKNVMKVLKSYSPNIEDRILEQQTLSPLDLEEKFSLSEGHVFHGEHALDQYMTRPIPECAQYQSPYKGLYLSGSGSHPGGGITGRPGSLAAREILKTMPAT